MRDQVISDTRGLVGLDLLSAYSALHAEDALGVPKIEMRYSLGTVTALKTLI